MSERHLRRLVLIGAGRANLHLLRALSRSFVRGLEIVLVTPDRELFDASMTAGLLRGAYRQNEACIDVAAVAARAGARVVQASADRVLLDEHAVHAGSERLGFDLCVIDEVGPSLDTELPGVTEYAIALRPTSRLTDIRRIVDERLARSADAVACVVVGGGTTGVEVAFWLQRLIRERPAGGVVSIVDAAPDILADAAPCRDIARSALERAGVCFALGAGVVEVFADRVTLASGGSLQSDLTVWATGGAPTSLVAASGLPHDERGRLLVDEHLRARDGSAIWAAGDSAGTVENDRDPRGQETLLEREIRRHLGAPVRPRVRSRSIDLCVLDTGDGQAILRWRALTMRSRLAWWIKHRLARRYLSRMREA